MKTTKTPEQALISFLEHIARDGQRDVFKYLCSFRPFVEAITSVQQHFVGKDTAYNQYTVELTLNDAEQMVEAMRKDWDAMREAYHNAEKAIRMHTSEVERLQGKLDAIREIVNTAE